MGFVLFCFPEYKSCENFPRNFHCQKALGNTISSISIMPITKFMPLRTPAVRHPFNISQIDFSMEPLFQVAPSNILQSWFSLGHFRDLPLPPGFFQLPPASLLCNQSSPGYQVIFLVGNLTMLYLNQKPSLTPHYRTKHELFSLTFKIHPHATLNDNLRLLLSSIYPLDPRPFTPCASLLQVFILK